MKLCKPDFFRLSLRNRTSCVNNREDLPHIYLFTPQPKYMTEPHIFIISFFYTFSCSSGILLHTPQTHHGPVSFSGGGCTSGSSPESTFLANSTLPRPWLSNQIRSLSLSPGFSFPTNSSKKKEE